MTTIMGGDGDDDNDDERDDAPDSLQTPPPRHQTVKEETDAEMCDKKPQKREYTRQATQINNVPEIFKSHQNSTLALTDKCD